MFRKSAACPFSQRLQNIYNMLLQPADGPKIDRGLTQHLVNTNSLKERQFDLGMQI